MGSREHNTKSLLIRSQVGITRQATIRIQNTSDDSSFSTNFFCVFYFIGIVPDFCYYFILSHNYMQYVVYIIQVLDTVNVQYIIRLCVRLVVMSWKLLLIFCSIIISLSFWMSILEWWGIDGVLHKDLVSVILGWKGSMS